MRNLIQDLKKDSKQINNVMRSVYMKHLIILIVLLLLSACSSPSCDETEFNLIGSWELFEFCVSPGDITCPVQTPDQEQILEFRMDSTFSLTIDGQIMDNGSFSVSNSVLTFMGQQDDQTFGNSRFISIQGSCEVDLNPLCIEECRSSYEKID